MKLEHKDGEIIDLQKHEKVKKVAINEFKIMTELDHPHIVRTIETYQDARNFVLVTEFCEGKDLFNYIIRQDRLDEKQAA